MVGRQYRSATRAAAMPMTPGFQSGLCSRMLRWSVRSCACSIRSTSCKIAFSSAFRWLLSLSNASAISAAQALSRVRSSSTHWPASSSRPAAFSRGANRKARSRAVNRLPLGFATRFNACRPTQHSPRFSAPNPRATKARFSPVRGITSAVVARATRGKNPIAPSFPSRAQASL